MIIGLLPDMGNWVHSMGYFRSFRETITTAFENNLSTAFYGKTVQINDKYQELTIVRK